MTKSRPFWRAVSAPEELPERVRGILAGGEVKVSVVSYWELVLKKGRQTAPVRQPAAWWERYITRPAVEVLPVRVAHVDQLDALPRAAQRPFRPHPGGSGAGRRPDARHQGRHPRPLWRAGGLGMRAGQNGVWT